MVTGMKDLPYEDRLAQLGLWSLEERRHRADLLEVFRMYKGLSLTPFSQFFYTQSSQQYQRSLSKDPEESLFIGYQMALFLSKSCKSLELFTSTCH